MGAAFLIGVSPAESGLARSGMVSTKRLITGILLSN